MERNRQNKGQVVKRKKREKKSPLENKVFYQHQERADVEYGIPFREPFYKQKTPLL